MSGSRLKLAGPKSNQLGFFDGNLTYIWEGLARHAYEPLIEIHSIVMYYITMQNQYNITHRLNTQLILFCLCLVFVVAMENFRIPNPVIRCKGEYIANHIEYICLANVNEKL